jgi:hypothetical protein
MKKTIMLIAAVAFVATSCKKQYTCECTSYENGTAVMTYSYSAKLKKSDADVWCGDYSETTTFGSTTYKDECKVK